MFNHNFEGDSLSSTILTAAVIAGSALLFYAFVASPVIPSAAPPARTPAFVEHVVVTAPASGHVS